MPQNVTVKSLAFSGDVVLIGAIGVGIYRSTDKGNIWVLSNYAIKSIDPFRLIVSEKTLFAGTWRMAFTVQLTRVKAGPRQIMDFYYPIGCLIWSLFIMIYSRRIYSLWLLIRPYIALPIMETGGLNWIMDYRKTG